MRTEIKIVVELPLITGQERLDFVTGVMDVFKKVFPGAEQLDPRMHPYTPPVTVTMDQVEPKPDDEH